MGPVTEADLEERFNYHPPPTDSVIYAHTTMRSAMLTAARNVVAKTPPCREQSLALTKLEEAMMWANAAVARNHEHYTGVPEAK